jgi:hypothetical protein
MEQYVCNHFLDLIQNFRHDGVAQWFTPSRDEQKIWGSNPARV